MITDREIWQAANAMIKRYGEDAAGEAAMCYLIVALLLLCTLVMVGITIRKSGFGYA